MKTNNKKIITATIGAIATILFINIYTATTETIALLFGALFLLITIQQLLTIKKGKKQ